MRDVRIEPLTPDRWADLERLFGPRGACGGCWCMTMRLTRADYERGKGEGNRRALRRLVQAGRAPGLLAYVRGEPAGWCSVGPREEFARLAGSRILAPVDAEPVWSIVCLFVAKAWRGRGLSRALVEGAVAYAGRSGARIVEAYPVEPRTTPMPPVFAFTGIASAFRAAGFEEAARRAPTRPIVRRTLSRASPPPRRGPGSAR